MEASGSGTVNDSMNRNDEHLIEYNSNNVKKARLMSTLSALLDDPILADVPRKPSLSDVDTLISLELGSAMRISILKLDGSSLGEEMDFLTTLRFVSEVERKLGKDVVIDGRDVMFSLHFPAAKDVVVMDTATVKDLKESITRKISEMEQSKMGHRHISWKHVWSNFCLSHHNNKLLDDNTALQDYGIRNNSQVQFTPHIISKDSRKHSRRRRHRFFHGLNKKA